ncbi:MAG: hypothetical protein IPI31_02240 [Bacteroidetes bacterium]|nr:hypothetical protein [Bacteroidota bacterium]
MKINRTILFWGYVFFLAFVCYIFPIPLLKYTVGFPIFVFVNPVDVGFIFTIILFVINCFIQFLVITFGYELIRDGFKLKTGID